MLKWLALVAGILVALVGIGIAVVLHYHFIVDEMTDGAFLKQYFFESLVSAVLVVTGTGLVLWSQDRRVVS